MKKLREKKGEIAIAVLGAITLVCIGIGFVQTFKTNMGKIKEAHNAPITVDK